MVGVNSQKKTLLAEQFADLYRECQENSRSLLEAVLDSEIELADFDAHARAFHVEMLRLKEMKLQIEELKRSG
jgi:hypothetical protein